MKTRLPWIAAVVLCSAAAVAAALWWPRGAELPAEVRPAAHVAGRPAGDTAVAASAAPAAATPKARRLAVQYQMTLEAPNKTGSRTAAKLAVRGELAFAALTSGKGPEQDVVRFVASELEMNEAAANLIELGQASAKAVGLAGDAKAALAAPFVVVRRADGAVQEVRFGLGLTSAAKGLLTTMVTASQFSQPDDAKADQWQVQEADINGSYLATYARKADGKIAKTWQADANDLLAGASHAPGYHCAFAGQFDYAAGLVTAADLTWQGTVGTGLAGKANRATFAHHLTLQALADGPAPWASLDIDALQRFEPLLQARVGRTAGLQGELPDLMAAVAHATKREATADRQRIADAIAHKIRTDAKALPHVEQQLRAVPPIDEPLQRTLIEAVVRSDTAASRTVLSGLIADASLREDLREQVLAGAVFVPSPDDAFATDLEKVALQATDPFYASMAAMTLGAALQRLQQRDPPAAASHLQTVVAHAGSLVAPNGLAAGPARATTGAIANWMLALGNTGSPLALPVLLQGLVHKQERVRRSAALALRFQDPAKALPAMQAAMQRDDSIHVRDNLVQAARYMGAAEMQAFVTKALMTDESQWVRLSAAHTIAAWANVAPQLVQVLQDALEREKSKKVRESLRNLMEPGRVAAPFRQVPMGGKGQ